MHRTAQHWTSAGFVLLPLLFLSGCGPSGLSGGAGQQGAATPSTTASATRVATMTVTPPPGAVTLLLGQTHAGVTDAVSVTVANGLPTTIVVADHQSECTVVTLERQAGAKWLAVASCQLETPTRLLPIPSNAARTVKLQPADGPQPHVWQAGTFRFMLQYSTGAQTSAGKQTNTATLAREVTVYSQTFTIG